MFHCHALACFLMTAAPFAALGAPMVEGSDAHRGSHGILVHTVNSPYQSGQTEIRVLAPDHIEDGKRYPVVYVVPVESGRGSRFGDRLLEVQKHDLQNKHRAIFVAPTFSDLPW